MNLKRCINSILYNRKLTGGREVVTISKDIDTGTWNSYNYNDSIEEFDELQLSWFTKYCFDYANNMKNMCDERIFSKTLANFNSSISAAHIRNQYYDYDRDTIDKIIGAAILTGYYDSFNITNVFSHYWKKESGIVFLKKNLLNI